jgi:anti-repressor protein
MQMNDLIKITEKDGKQLVGAKELYLGLGLRKADWSRWYVTNVEKNEYFSENIDWIGVPHNAEGNETMDFAISLEFAKHIAMMARTEKSHEYRNYFINCEEKLKKSSIDTTKLSLETQLILKLSQSIAEQEIYNKQMTEIFQETKQEIQTIREVILINPQAEWRKETNKILSKIGMKLEDYQKPKDEAYNALKERGKCRPSVLILNLKERAAKNGMAKNKIDKINILDVLENEPRLREIYITIVKEMAIKYGV